MINPLSVVLLSHQWGAVQSANQRRISAPAQCGVDIAGNLRHFRKRCANRHRVGGPAQCGAGATGMVGRGVANVTS